MGATTVTDAALVAAVADGDTGALRELSRAMRADDEPFGAIGF